MTFDLETQRGQLGLFVAFQFMGGQFGMLLILLTIFIHRRITRHAIFANFCVSWMLYSGSYILLLYAGQIGNAKPDFALCVTQAAAIYGAPAMIGVSLLMFVLHLFLVLREGVHALPPGKWEKLRLVAMLAAPYITYLVVFTTAIILGNAQPQRVKRSSLYCTIGLPEVTDLAAGISAGAAVGAITIEILTAITLHRHWRAFRNATNTGLNLSILIRVLVFSACSILALLTCMAFLANMTSPVFNIIIACLPMAAFLVFGTQSDLLRPWCFWQKYRDGKIPDEESDEKSDAQLASSSSTSERLHDSKGVLSV